MRKPFRTTIDEDILANLKKRAIDENCNVNDIIESLVVKSLSTEYFLKHDHEYFAMTNLSKEMFLTRKINQAIDNVLTPFKLSYILSPSDTIEIISRCIAQLVLSESIKNEQKK